MEDCPTIGNGIMIKWRKLLRLLTEEHCQYDGQLKFTAYQSLLCSGKVMQGASSGPDLEPYLNVTEETELIQFLTKCARMGAKSRFLILLIGR